MRLPNLLHRQHLLHRILKRTTDKLRQHFFLKQIPQLALILGIPTPQRTPLIPRPLAQNRANIHALAQRRAAHDTQHDDPAVHGQDIQVLLEIRRRDKVDDEVHAVAVVGFLEGRGPVWSGGGVDGGFGAEGLHAKVAFCVFTGGGEDGGGGGGGVEGELLACY